MWKANYKAGYLLGAVYLASFSTTLWLYGFNIVGWSLAFALHFFIFNFGVSFGLHKAIAHQIAPARHWLVRTAALVGVLSNTGSPLDFIITHRLHHEHADSVQDPQQFRTLGWRLLFGIREEAADPVGQLYASRAVLRDPFFVWLHNHYYPIILVYHGLLFAVGGLYALLFAGLVPGGLSFFGVGALNFFGHYRGEPRNTWWLFPLAFGESWHKNHHVNPGSLSNRRRAWELDPSAIYFSFVGPRIR